MCGIDVATDLISQTRQTILFGRDPIAWILRAMDMNSCGFIDRYPKVVLM
jgi:hypothetical protein